MRWARTKATVPKPYTMRRNSQMNLIQSVYWILAMTSAAMKYPEVGYNMFANPSTNWKTRTAFGLVISVMSTAWRNQKVEQALGNHHHNRYQILWACVDHDTDVIDDYFQYLSIFQDDGNCSGDTNDQWIEQDVLMPALMDSAILDGPITGNQSTDDSCKQVEAGEFWKIPAIGHYTVKHAAKL